MLQKALGTSVILPEIGEPPFPVLHLLHGLSDDHTTWLRRTSLERYVEKLPLIVVLPDGSRGFYTNHHAGPSYAEHFAHELPAFIERNFPARSGREHRCVGGLSMGGYGALGLALGYPDRYVSATIHSGALMRGSRPPQQTRMGIGDELERIFGPSPKGSDHDLLRLAAIAKKSGRLPKLRLDCGAQDFFSRTTGSSIALSRSSAFRTSTRRSAGDMTGLTGTPRCARPSASTVGLSKSRRPQTKSPGIPEISGMPGLD